MSGSRKNKGKLRWDLVDFKSLENLVKVLEKGAEKYTESCIFTSENLTNICHPASTIQIEKLSLEDFVDLVTINNLKLKILDIEEGNSLVLKTGMLQTLKRKLKSGQEEKDLTLKNKKKLDDWLIENEVLLDMVFPMKTTSNLNRRVAQFAGQWKGYMLTIATNPENSVQSYVVSATRDLDCLMTIFNVLKQQQIISKDITIENNEIVISGKDNWKKGLNREEVLESTLRHLIELFNGNEQDSETEEHHMSHVMCNAMFYLHFHRNKNFSKKRNNPF